MAGERGFSYVLLLAAVAVAIAVGAAIYFAVRPDPGRTEFERAQQALRGVHSWRYETSSSINGMREESRHEVVCPDRQHIASKGFGGSSGSDLYFVQGVSYQGGRAHVTREGQVDYLNPEPLCLQLARGEDTDPFPPFAVFLKSGNFREGSIMTVAGVKCRQWTILFPLMQSYDNEEVCIGVEDHLPRLRKSSFNRITYLEYNTPLEIRAPTVTLEPLR